MDGRRTGGREAPGNRIRLTDPLVRTEPSPPLGHPHDRAPAVVGLAPDVARRLEPVEHALVALVDMPSTTASAVGESARLADQVRGALVCAVEPEQAVTPSAVLS